MTTVLVIDDQPIVFEGCRRVLEEAGIRTVIQARNLVSGYRLYYRYRSDVMVMDLDMRGPKLRGLSLIRRISSQDRRTRVLIFCMNDDPALVTSALEAGASGYLLKDSPSEELVKRWSRYERVCPTSATCSSRRLSYGGRGLGRIRYRILQNGRSRR